jgi:hypothetical protein
LLEAAEVAAPVQAKAQRRVEDRRRVEVEKLAVDARRARQIVVAAVGQAVAGGAGHDIAARETDVVEQLLPEPHLGGIEGNGARNRRDRLGAGWHRGRVARVEARLRAQADRGGEHRSDEGHRPPGDRGLLRPADRKAVAEPRHYSHASGACAPI